MIARTAEMHCYTHSVVTHWPRTKVEAKTSWGYKHTHPKFMEKPMHSALGVWAMACTSKLKVMFPDTDFNPDQVLRFNVTDSINEAEGPYFTLLGIDPNGDVAAQVGDQYWEQLKPTADWEPNWIRECDMNGESLPDGDMEVENECELIGTYLKAHQWLERNFRPDAAAPGDLHPLYMWITVVG